MPGEQELPSTLRRSPRKAQETFAKAHDAAVETYGEGQSAHRVAFAAVKHSYEKVGDRWQPKPEKGPSDAQASQRYGQRPKDTAQGVNANASRAHLLDVARELAVPGSEEMTKPELVSAIEKANARATRRARSGQK
jgi:cation transport regulator ChaB